MKKKTSSHNNLYKENIIDTLKLPRDVCLGVSCVTLTGNREAWIENYKGILEYTESQIILQTKTCQIILEGKDLKIDYYTNEDMKITGYILCVKYL